VSPFEEKHLFIYYLEPLPSPLQEGDLRGAVIYINNNAKLDRALAVLLQYRITLIQTSGPDTALEVLFGELCSSIYYTNRQGVVQTL